MPIDISLLRDSIRTELEIEELLSLLDRAIELIPQERLPELIEGFFDLDLLSVDELSEQSLLDDVLEFHSDSLAGLYYDDFDVNSKNFMERSRGTINWMAEHERLMNRCLIESSSGNPEQIRQAFELLFNLLDEIDECRDDIIFFADEGGAWQVRVEWDEVLPCYFKVLAAVAQPSEYAESVIKIVKSHANYNSDNYFKLALEVAKPPQKKVLFARLSKD
ncbi:MAG: hypothetical protein QNJ72_34055 [Pleurocapsa sp. MO_226.B13]|nr:hypothetical protein [Pleurocapsa sp. MO_226.B13]